ncbi:hypothetical protein QVD17_09008 [Tagetes erecta]|uniref:Uncharacterized protein n=1 Tax=Tagetes erecta TaxID=13708 RepID=A0AAD8L558_TARER|nr:hypothetical protein QVD17_09008 [Tagetes erecta]
MTHDRARQREHDRAGRSHDRAFVRKFRYRARPCSSDARPCPSHGGSAGWRTACASEQFGSSTTVHDLRTTVLPEERTGRAGWRTACVPENSDLSTTVPGQSTMDHEWLQFDSRDKHDRPCMPTLHLLWERRHQIECARYLDWSLVESLNQSGRMQPMMTPPWTRLFSIQHPQYTELIIEFFATFQFSFPSRDIYRKRHGVRFRLGGTWRKMSVAEFAQRMGLYTESELQTELFDGLHDFRSDFEKAGFWEEVASGPYAARTAKATKLRDPLHRFIHRVLVGTICLRGDSVGNVSTRDLFFLFCFIRRENINLGHCLANYLVTSSGKLPSSQICGGIYVTQMAESLGLLTPENVATLTLIYDTPALDLRTLRYMTLVVQTPAGWRLKDKEGRIWDPIPAEEEPEDEEEDVADNREPENVGGTTFAAGGTQHDDFMSFMDNLDAADAAAIPTVPQMWNRFVEFETAQTTMQSDIELQRQRMDAFSLEQERQGSMLESIQDETRRGFDWLFSSHQTAAAFHHYDLPAPPFTYASFGQNPGQKRSRKDGASGSGANQDN